MSTDTAVRVVNLEKRFRRARGGMVTAVSDVSLEIERGEMVVVLGPSGCGKTTLLRCIAGLEAPTAGEVHSGGRILSSGRRGIIVPPEKRDFGMMFQSYAVWPHMSVFENVAYALKVRHLPKTEIEERVTHILELVGIGHLRDEYSSQLSGGQQQRIALARSLVADPEVILFDEPLSNVDAKVREELRLELLTMQKRIGFAGVYVTHDQEEAMAIADRIVVMRDGQVIQVGPPSEIYEAPQSRFVASFIGVVNELLGVVKDDVPASMGRVVVTDLGEVVVTEANMPPGTAAGDQVAVLMRPEALSVMSAAEAGPDRLNAWPGTLQAVMFRGAYKDHLVAVGPRLLRSRANSSLNSAAETTHEKPLADGDQVVVVASPRSIRAIAVGTEAGSEERIETAPSDGARVVDGGNG